MRSMVTKHLEAQAKDFAQDWWHLLDNNCDGVLGGGEAAIGTAIILGQDPSHFQKMWDAWPFCLRGGAEYPPPHFVFHLTSEFHVHVGRFDRHPCFLESVLQTVSNFTFKGNISKNIFRGFLKRWLTNLISIEEVMFEARLDTDKDGCLSEKEWTTYGGKRSRYKHQMSQTVTMPDFLAIANFRPQRSLMIGGEDVYASRCVTAFRFGLWSALSLIEGIPVVNHSAPCHTENQQHSPLDSTSILPWILVGCSLACFGLCMICTGAWYLGKCHHKLNHMQAKMENKMDASSMFDTELSAMVSSLNSSFLDCLGLSGFQEDQLSLLQLVHPEDKSSMHSALAQCKGPNGCKSAPISCEVRLQHGCRGKLQQGDLQSNVKYMHVKLAMTLSSKSTIDVGLTRLSGNRTCPMPADRAIVQAMDVRKGAGITWDVVTANQIARRPCGAISNEELLPVVLGSNVSSNSVSSIEHSFKTAELRHIATLGIEEHWIIPSEHVSLVSEDVEQGGFGKVRRGLLLGSADVAVKSAITDASEQALASKCEVLANEVRLFRRIHHQNIVLFHGAIFTSGPGNTVQMGLVLEWVAGGNLEQYYNNCHMTGTYDFNNHINSEKTMKTKSDCGLLVDIIRGMVYLHASRPIILHRDLKPANVLLDTNCAPPRAKLTDFGLSMLIEHDMRVRSRAGTESYMAPEVKKGQPYSTMVDVFSFGGIIVFFYTGRHPQKDAHEFTFARDVSAMEPLMGTVLNAACMCLQSEASLRPTFHDLFNDFSQAFSTMTS